MRMKKNKSYKPIRTTWLVDSAYTLMINAGRWLCLHAPGTVTASPDEQNRESCRNGSKRFSNLPAATARPTSSKTDSPTERQENHVDASRSWRARDWLYSAKVGNISGTQTTSLEENFYLHVTNKTRVVRSSTEIFECTSYSASTKQGVRSKWISEQVPGN